MNKILLISVIALAVAAGASFAADATKSGKKADAPKEDCGDCPMHKKAAAAKKGAHNCPGSEKSEHGGKMCPEKIAGVETVSKNIPEGVELTMTAKTKETAAQVQELAIVHYGNKETMAPACPGRVEGAESRIENTADGVKVFITGKTPEAIAKIQAASAKEHMKAGCPEKKEGKKEAKAAKKYICPMKCAESDKPGKCPKCGMDMTEKK